MRHPSFFLIASISLLLCLSCGGSDNPATPDEQQPVQPTQKLPISISTTIARATETDFESGDRAGLFVVNRRADGSATPLKASGNHVDNMLYTYSTMWTPASPTYWKDDNTKADFYFYSPYRTPLTSVDAMMFDTPADQSSVTAHKSADLIIGSALNMAPTDAPVAIAARHVMSQVTIALKPGTGFTTASLADAQVVVSLNNLCTTATVSLATASTTPTGATQKVTAYNAGDVYRAFVVPQSVAECSLITVTVDGSDYKFTKAFTFESGKSHTLTLTVDKKNCGISVTVGPWETDGIDHGGTAT